jgi:hypothetical protein
MKAKDLMKPRFEVIADYPKCPITVGRILTPIFDGAAYYESLDEPASETVTHPEKYPHIFRKLNWWEHRTVEEMPKRLICKAVKMDKTIHEIESWDMDELFGWTDKRNRVGCGLTSFNPEYGYFPVN